MFTKSLPINTKLPSLTTTDTVFKSADIPIVTEAAEEFGEAYSETTVEPKNETKLVAPVNVTRDALFRQIRVGQEVRRYTIELTANGDTFNGRAVLVVNLDEATREDPIVLHADQLDINSVRVGVFTEANAVDAGFALDAGILEIFPEVEASTYIVIIEYSGQLTDSGKGLYLGHYDDE